MSKELPYFKFYPTEYLLGSITLQDFRLQGVFINLCAYYWQKGCVVSKGELDQRFSNASGDLDFLKKANIIYVTNENFVKIKFLDEQWGELYKTHLKRKKSGRLGGQASVKHRLSNAQATLKHLDKDKEEDKDKNKDSDFFSIFGKFRDAYPGTKRGLEIEFANFKKKAQDWRKAVLELHPCLMREVAYKARKRALGEFVPEWKHMRTWINQSCWTESYPEVEKEKPKPTELVGAKGFFDV